MFDLVGVAAIGDSWITLPTVEDAYLGEPWQGVGIARRVVVGQGVRSLCLSRPDEPEAYATTGSLHLFLVGAAFPRLDALGELTPAAGRLSAPTLLDGYLRLGERLLDLIKGDFAIVLLEGSTGEHKIIASRFAVAPLYYAVPDRRLFFSTSLAEVGRLFSEFPDLDFAALVETSLLNFPLGDRTFLRGVRRLAPGAIVTVRAGGCSIRQYWDARDLYHSRLMKPREALEQLGDLFYRCANSMVADHQRICASFTSGFDSRAIQAVLEKDRGQILSYAFGITGSLNVSIPEALCAELGYPFLPIYLDAAYDESFDSYAALAVMLSDGLVVQRANYPYAFQRLSAFAPVVMTGIFGSELLRTFQNVGLMVSAGFVRLNRASEPLAELTRLLSEARSSGYLSAEALDASRDEVEADVAHWCQWCHGLTEDQRFYMYVLREGARKYFGAEVSMERAYAANYFPFLDDEFVEMLFQAPFAGVHSRTIEPTVANRYRSQRFYGHLVRKHRPELMPYPTDHGYSPADVMAPLAMLRVGPKHLWTRWKRRRASYREFRSEDLIEGFYERYLAATRRVDGAFSTRFETDFRSGAWKANRAEFNKVGALRLWLAQAKDKVVAG